MRDLVAFEAALKAVVEVLEHFAGREPCRADTDLASVVLTRRDLAFETRGEVFLMRPTFGPGPVREPRPRRSERRSFECPAHEREIRRWLLRGHDAVPPSRS